MADQLKNVQGDANRVLESQPVRVTQLMGSAFTDQSVASLSAGQAAGTATVIGANDNRQVLVIVPPADCTLTIASGASAGVPLYGGVPNSFNGAECPANALYVKGLAAGVSVTIWEA